MSDDLQGGCLCGAIRFRVHAAPVFSEFCHCDTCRRASGAPVMAWVGIPVQGFAVTCGEPAQFSSSKSVTRGFCGRCGTSLTIYSQDFPDEIYVSIVAFDQADEVKPEAHIWTSDQLTWLHIGDDLPRHARFGSDDEN